LFNKPGKISPSYLLPRAIIVLYPQILPIGIVKNIVLDLLHILAEAPYHIVKYPLHLFEGASILNKEWIAKRNRIQ